MRALLVSVTGPLVAPAMAASTFTRTITITPVPTPVCQDVWTNKHGDSSAVGADSNTRYNACSSIAPPLNYLCSISYGSNSAVNDTSPAVDANGAYFTLVSPGSLVRVDPSTCAQICTANLSNPVLSSPALSNGIAYVADSGPNAYLYAIDQLTCTICWSYPIGGVSGLQPTCPIVCLGRVFVGGYNGTFYGFPVGCTPPGAPACTFTGAGAGNIHWAAGGASTQCGSVIVYGDSIGNIFAVDYNCTPLWSASMPGGGVRTTPSIYCNRVFVAGEGGELSAYDICSGTLAWTFTGQGPFDFGGGPAIDPTTGRLYIGGRGAGGNGIVYCLTNLCGGSPVQPAGWPVTSFVSEVRSAPAVANGFVYVGTLGSGSSGTNTLYALNGTSGVTVWSYALPTNVTGGEGIDSNSPAIANGKLYETSDSGNGLWVFAPGQSSTPTETQTATPAAPSATFTPTGSPTVTATVTLTKTVTNTSDQTPSLTPTGTLTPTETCAVPLGSATPPFIGLDRNVFDPAHEKLGIVWEITIPAPLAISIYNSAGEFIRRLDIGVCDPGRVYYALWDGRNYLGNTVAAGVYLVALYDGNSGTPLLRRVGALPSN